MKNKVLNLKDKKLKAYTLAEVVLYLGLFGFIFTTIITFFFVTDEFNRNDKYQVEIAKSTVFIVEHLEESFRSTKSIDTANSTFDTDVGVLTLIRSDDSTIRYSVSNNRIIALTSASNFISPAEIIINKFQFQRIEEDGIVVGVRFELDMTSARSDRLNKQVSYTYVIQ